MTAVRNDAHFDKMIYPADVAEAAMLVIRTSFNCCPTQIWLQNNPDIIHKVRSGQCSLPLFCSSIRSCPDGSYVLKTPTDVSQNCLQSALPS